MASTKASIYIPTSLKWIVGNTEQGGLTQRIANILERYGKVLNHVDIGISPAELKTVELITGNNTKILFTGQIVAEIVNAPDDVFVTVNREELAEKVRNLSTLQLVAIAERIERFMRK